MRKFFVLLSSLFLIFSLTACGDGSSGAGASDKVFMMKMDGDIQNLYLAEEGQEEILLAENVDNFYYFQNLDALGLFYKTADSTDFYIRDKSGKEEKIASDVSLRSFDYDENNKRIFYRKNIYAGSGSLYSYDLLEKGSEKKIDNEVGLFDLVKNPQDNSLSLVYLNANNQLIYNNLLEKKVIMENVNSYYPDYEYDWDLLFIEREKDPQIYFYLVSEDKLLGKKDLGLSSFSVFRDKIFYLENENKGLQSYSLYVENFGEFPKKIKEKVSNFAITEDEKYIYLTDDVGNLFAYDLKTNKLSFLAESVDSFDLDRQRNELLIFDSKGDLYFKDKDNKISLVDYDVFSYHFANGNLFYIDSNKDMKLFSKGKKEDVVENVQYFISSPDGNSLLFYDSDFKLYLKNANKDLQLISEDVSSYLRLYLSNSDEALFVNNF